MEDIWIRQPRHIHSANRQLNSRVRYTWAGPIDAKLYSDSLVRLSKFTEQNLSRLERSRNREYSLLPYEFQTKPASGLSSLSGSNIIATWKTSRSMSGSARDNDTLSIESVTAPVNSCYLCSTLDQHHSHILGQQALKKKVRKPRICYIAPPPRVRPKLIEEPPADFDNRYKVVVWTGNKQGATTSANVYITLKGNRNILHKTRLCHGSAASKPFCFCQGARDVFYLKSPTLGHLEMLTVELDPDGQKQCSWYCDKIEVMCLKTLRCWLFECDNWLSLSHGDYRIARDLTAINLQKRVQEFEVTVTTGSKKLSGTDANVFITLYGSAGRSPKIKLTADSSRKLFQRNCVDNFFVKFTDIGEIRSLRIEHDGTGFAPGWFLEHVVLKELKHPENVYYFPFHGWLARDFGDGQLSREIRAKKTLAKEVISAEERRRQKRLGKVVKYTVTVHTGDVCYGGTDANVYIIIEGVDGKTKKLFLNDSRNNFEKGMIEDFEVQAFNTGPIKSIYIGHDNTGPGSGWYCEDVTVKKYLSSDEQIKYLKRLKKKLQNQMKLRDSTSFTNEKRNIAQNNDSEEEMKEHNFRNVFDAEGRVLKIPLYEEYYFECKAWLAKDEGDGLLERELEVKEKSVVFKEKRKDRCTFNQVSAGTISLGTLHWLLKKGIEHVWECPECSDVNF